MNRINEPKTVQFLDIIHELNLFCSIPLDKTHEDGNTIDFIVTDGRSENCSDDTSDGRIQSLNVDYLETLSDHYPLLFNLCIDKAEPCDQPTPVMKRAIHKIDLIQFKADVYSSLSSGFENIAPSDFPSLCSAFTNSLAATLDVHAPLKKVNPRTSERPKWFDHEYILARAKRRRLEKHSKSTGIPDDRCAYVRQRNLCTHMARQKREGYYSGEITARAGDQKALFNFSKSLIDKNQKSVQLPDHSNDLDLANEANQFFIDKVQKIRDFIPKDNKPSLSFPTDDIHTPNNSNDKIVFDDVYANNDKILSVFRPTSDEEVLKILKTSGIKVSELDPVPAHLLVDSLDEIVPFFTVLINASLSTGCIDGVKEALVFPLLKNANLDYNTFVSYRPISNLSFISKLTERIVHSRLNEHMDMNNLHCNTQYGYKKYHSTETLLLKFMNDILVAMDCKSGVVVLLIDLSAAFDTVDHQVLLKILHDDIGVRGIALKWFHSFLTGRSQRVQVGTSRSEPLDIIFGVPQGSVLGPVLFNIYSRSLSSVFSEAGFSSSGYADDNSGLRIFSSGSQEDVLTSSVANCIDLVKSWMNSYFLKLNESKSEIIVFGDADFQRSLNIHGMFTKSGDCIRFSDKIKYLGVFFDKHMYLDTHINRVVSSSYYHLRSISSIRRYISQAQTEQLVHAFISSKLDMCNALFFGLSKWHIAKLQRVQNAAMRIVLGKKKRESVKDCYKTLHWLTVEQRIVFKVLLLTFKCLNDMGPVPLANLLVPKYSFDNYSSAIKLEECTFRAKTAHGKRAFIFYAPRIWNCLPDVLRACCNVNTFKSLLKTHLFSQFDKLKAAINKYTQII